MDIVEGLEPLVGEVDVTVTVDRKKLCEVAQTETVRVSLISTKLVVREEYRASFYHDQPEDFFMRNHVLNYLEVTTCFREDG